MVVARTSFRAARVELSSASILPEYPTTSAASMAASLRTVRSMVLSLATAPSLCMLPDLTYLIWDADFSLNATPLRLCG